MGEGDVRKCNSGGVKMIISNKRGGWEIIKSKSQTMTRPRRNKNKIINVH